MKLRLTLVAVIVAFGNAYQPSTRPAKAKKVVLHSPKLAVAAATAALSLLLSTAEPAIASDTAAQITLNRLPPTSIDVEIKDLPVVGNLLSGTYTKVPDGSVKQPSLVIRSPTDKVKAIQSIATGGHLEFDVSGIISTHLDVDVAAEQAGVAKIRVASNLIPKLPFKNLAAPSTGSPTGGKESPWNMVTNMGSGER